MVEMTVQLILVLAIQTNQYKYFMVIGGDTKHIKKIFQLEILFNYNCWILRHVIFLDSVTILQPRSIISYISTSLATCGDSTGTASVHITGGKNPFTYYWYPMVDQILLCLLILISGNYGINYPGLKLCSQKYYFEIGDSNGAEIHVDSIRKCNLLKFPDGAIFTHYRRNSTS